MSTEAVEGIQIFMTVCTKRTVRGIDMFERFPKLHSPFVREETPDGLYLVKDMVHPDYEWVFEDESVRAVEKLDGENIAVYIDEEGNVSHIYTREGNLVTPFEDPYTSYIVKGVLDAYRRGWLDSLEHGTLHYGELIGPTVKQNPYDWHEHMWVPFEYLYEKVYYESWGRYPTTFEAVSSWFNDGLLPLFYARMHNLELDELPNKAYVEGVVFVHPDGRKAKLRRDMFDWFEGERHGERD